MTKPTAAEKLDARIEAIIKEKFDHYLSDLSFRIEQAYDLIGRVNNTEARAGKVYAEDLNLLNRVQLTGYVVTNDTPAVGSISWSDLHVVLNGQNYDITNGSTANKFVWWSPTTTPTVLQSNNVKPTLGVNEVLLFINESGKHKVMLSDTNASLPSVVANLSIDTGAIQNSAVGNLQIANTAIDQHKLGSNAVVAGKVAAGAINSSAVFTTGVVNSAAIGDNQVVAGKINAGAINNASLFVNGVVGANAVGNNVLTNAHINGAIIGSAEIVGGAVGAGKLAAGAINSNTLFTQGVINNAAIASGAVLATNLNVARHFLY